MQVFKCIVTDVEYFSDAKRIEEVKDDEGNDTGLVRVKAELTSESGKVIGIGDDDDQDEVEEKKLDQFWSFPDIENEITFGSKKEFKETYWQFYQDAFVKLAKHLSLFSSKEDFKAAGMRFKTAQKWILKNFSSLQFFTVESYLKEVEEGEYGTDKFKGETFCANIAYVLYDGVDPYFYFVKDAFKASSF